MIYFVYFIKSYCCLFRNEAEIWRRWGSAGPWKPAGRRRTRAGLALPLWPLPVWRELPLQVSPQLERMRGENSGRRGVFKDTRGRSLSEVILGTRTQISTITWDFVFQSTEIYHKKDLQVVAIEWTSHCWTSWRIRKVVDESSRSGMWGVCAYFFFLSLCHLLSPY